MTAAILSKLHKTTTKHSNRANRIPSWIFSLLLWFLLLLTPVCSQDAPRIDAKPVLATVIIQNPPRADGSIYVHDVILKYEEKQIKREEIVLVDPTKSRNYRRKIGEPIPQIRREKKIVIETKSVLVAHISRSAYLIKGLTNPPKVGTVIRAWLVYEGRQPPGRGGSAGYVIYQFKGLDHTLTPFMPEYKKNGPVKDSDLHKSPPAI